MSNLPSVRPYPKKLRLVVYYLDIEGNSVRAYIKFSGTDTLTEEEAVRRATLYCTEHKIKDWLLEEYQHDDQQKA